MINVIIAGAQKAGTTSVLRYLGNHPDIVVHPQMEFTFLLNNDEYDQGNSFLINNYKLSKDKKKINVAKHATFTRNEIAIKRLHRDFPDCKVIFCTRDPIERAFSSYLMEKKHGSITEDFDEVIKIAFEKRTKHWYYNVIVDLGCYQKHINHLLKYFPIEQVKVVELEKIHSNHSQEINELTEWIGLPKINTNSQKVYNAKNEVSISKLQKIGAKYPFIKNTLINIFGYGRVVAFAKNTMNVLRKDDLRQEKLEDYPEAIKILKQFYELND